MILEFLEIEAHILYSTVDLLHNLTANSNSQQQLPQQTGPNFNFSQITATITMSAWPNNMKHD